MPHIKSLVIGNGVGQTVTDGRTLNAMERAGHFIRPDKHHPYVDRENRPRRFTFHEHIFEIRYFDGCFYPFVVSL